MRKTQRGITLIALVITIVVLIILAVISINIVFRENGIISRADSSKEYQANAEAYDQQKMEDLVTVIDDKINVVANSDLLKVTVYEQGGKILYSTFYVPKNTTWKEFLSEESNIGQSKLIVENDTIRLYPADPGGQFLHKPNAYGVPVRPEEIIEGRSTLWYWWRLKMLQMLY